MGQVRTTFIKKYATYLMRKGLNIGILENDHGAVNVEYDVIAGTKRRSV